MQWDHITIIRSSNVFHSNTQNEYNDDFTIITSFRDISGSSSNESSTFSISLLRSPLSRSSTHSMRCVEKYQHLFPLVGDGCWWWWLLDRWDVKHHIGSEECECCWTIDLLKYSNSSLRDFEIDLNMLVDDLISIITSVYSEVLWSQSHCWSLGDECFIESPTSNCSFTNQQLITNHQLITWWWVIHQITNHQLLTHQPATAY